MREHVDLKWRGDGLGPLTLNVIEMLLKPKREPVDIYEKQGILKAQHYRCNRCGETMRTGDAEADHITPLSRGGTKLQILCRECHQLKSTIDMESSRPWSHFTSTFNKAAYKAFASAEVPRTPPANMVLGECNDKEVQFGVDLVKCRANALRQPGYEWSVFFFLRATI